MALVRGAETQFAEPALGSLDICAKSEKACVYVLSLSHSHLMCSLCRYGDMRKDIGFKIRDMWYNLGKHQAPAEDPG